jgi:hypothetical protein
MDRAPKSEPTDKARGFFLAIAKLSPPVVLFGTLLSALLLTLVLGLIPGGISPWTSCVLLLVANIVAYLGSFWFWFKYGKKFEPIGHPWGLIALVLSIFDLLVERYLWDSTLILNILAKSTLFIWVAIVGVKGLNKAAKNASPRNQT